MKEKILELKKRIQERLDKADDLTKIEEINLEYFTKKGKFSVLIQELKDVPVEEKPLIGKIINETKQELLTRIENIKNELNNKLVLKRLEKEKINVNYQADIIKRGTIHPLTKVVNQVIDLFARMGFSVASGPEIELDEYNFKYMNLPENHPARDMQDTFYFDANKLLRTHTSPVQAREMLKNKNKELKIICPGKVYRRDEDDATHSHQFMQIEGLVLGKNISFANLKYTLEKMLKELFGEDKKIRMRPSYFPFTEPSIEVDVLFTDKLGNKKYIEILGAGMVHPNVLEMCGYDKNKFQGFAFGVGVERLAILKYGIEDIRDFYDNDLRLLNQF